MLEILQLEVGGVLDALDRVELADVIKPLGSGYYGSSLISFFSQMQEPNFLAVQIQKKEDVWSSFKTFLTKDRAKEDAA